MNVAIFVIFVGFAYALSRVWEAPGIALALSSAYAVLALASLAATKREIGRIDGARLLTSLAKILAAGAVMYALALAGTEILGLGESFWERLAILLLVGGGSTAAYLGVALALRAEELRAVLDLLKRRRNRSTAEE